MIYPKIIQERMELVFAFKFKLKKIFAFNWFSFSFVLFKLIFSFSESPINFGLL